MGRITVVLLGCPVIFTIDAWRFPKRAWRVAGYPRWVWKTVPISLFALAFLPLGIWWFRALVLAADASWVPYLAKVRPMLRLAGVLDTGTSSPVEHPGPVSIARIEAQQPPRRSRKAKWLSRLGLDLVLGLGPEQPRVVAVNDRGEEQVLFVEPTWEEAVAARDRVEHELHTMGVGRWRQLYGVPPDFFD